MKEIACYFGVTTPDIFAALKRLKIARKKTAPCKERCEQTRAQYISNIPPGNIIYVDESGSNRFNMLEVQEES